MATMKELKASNTVQGLRVATIMTQYATAREQCMNECIIKMAAGSTLKELDPFIVESQKVAKEKVIVALKESMQIVQANLDEAKTFEVRDEEFIQITELAVEKGNSIIQML